METQGPAGGPPVGCPDGSPGREEASLRMCPKLQRDRPSWMLGDGAPVYVGLGATGAELGSGRVHLVWRPQAPLA